MMVIAIGPQKMLRASGIMPKMAASAVSNTGRARRTVASMMARMPAVADGDVGRDWRLMKPADAGFILLSLGAGR